MSKANAKGKVQHQVAALPFRKTANGDVSVLLVSSRETHRPLIPKGWRMKGKSDRKAAAIEAMEEAGVIGTPSRQPIGRYRYWKRLADCFALVDVDVYSLEVTDNLADWPERTERQRQWMSLEDAAIVVDEPGLAFILQSFRT
jgi:NUDIX domain.